MHIFWLRQGLITACIALGSCVIPIQASAAAFPELPIRLVVGFPPGGGADFVARQVAQRLGAALNGTVMVENKPGANGAIAASEVARARPDGYTLLLGVTASQAISPALTKKPPYDPLRDFTALTKVGDTPLVLVVDSKSPVRSVQALLDLARASPTPLTYGSAGIGNITHMTAELFVQSSGVNNFRHIPYKGSSAVMQDLIGGRIDAYFDTLPSALPMIQSGQLRALAVTSRQRSENAPEIPTMTEAGVTGFYASTWFGVFGPANMKAELSRKIYEGLRSGFETREARQALSQRGVEPVFNTPSEFETGVEVDRAQWRTVADRAKITVE